MYNALIKKSKVSIPERNLRVYPHRKRTKMLQNKKCTILTFPMPDTASRASLTFAEPIILWRISGSFQAHSPQNIINNSLLQFHRTSSTSQPVFCWPRRGDGWDMCSLQHWSDCSLYVYSLTCIKDIRWQCQPTYQYCCGILGVCLKIGRSFCVNGTTYLVHLYIHSKGLISTYIYGIKNKYRQQYTCACVSNFHNLAYLIFITFSLPKNCTWESS